MNMKKTAAILILGIFLTDCSESRKKLSQILPFLISLFKTPTSSSAPTGGSSVTEPNPDDTAFASNSGGSNPSDTSDFGGSGSAGTPPVPAGPTTPPPIGTTGPIIDASSAVTGTVIKTTDVVDRYQDIVIEFSENMDRTTVCNGETAGALTLQVNGGSAVPASDMSCRWATDRQLLLRHYKAFLPYTKYDIIISSAAKPLFDSSTRSFTVFTNAVDAINSTGGNTYSFRTESAFNPSGITLNFNGTNYNYDSTKGMNLDSYGMASPANQVLLSYSSTDFSRAEIIRLKKVGVAPTVYYEICNTGCPNNVSLLNLSTLVPAALQVSNGMNAYYLELQARVTSTPLQYKRYYKTVNFNWGNHVQTGGTVQVPYGPEAKIPYVGMLVLDKGQSSWSALAGGSAEGTLDVLGHFIEHYASKYFTLNSDYASPGTPVNESLNQMLRRNSSTALPYPGCTNVNSFASVSCMNWSHYNDQNTFTQISPYGLFSVLEGYAKNSATNAPYQKVGGVWPTAKSPFAYLTQIGPFTGLQGRDRPYNIPDLTQLLDSTISAGVESMLTNMVGSAFPSAITDLFAGIIGDIVGAVMGTLLGGLVNTINAIAPLRLVYDFDADAYVKQAVFGRKTPAGYPLSSGPWYDYSADPAEESDLLRAAIDVVSTSGSGTGPKLDIKVKAKEINAELMANLLVSNVDLEFYFLKLIPFDPIHVAVSGDPCDYWDCIAGIPDVFSPKNWFDFSGPGPVDIWFNLAWNRVEMSWLTQILHGYYIARVFVDMNPSSNPPADAAHQSIYRIAGVQASAASGPSAELLLNVSNINDGAVPPRIKDIQGTEWDTFLISVPKQGIIGSNLLVNPLMMAASTDLSNATATMNAVTPPPFPINFIWDAIKSIAGNGASIVRGVVDAVLQDVLVTALPYVKPFIVEGMLSDFVTKVAANLFNAILYPLGKGIYLTMPDIVPDPIGKFKLNLAVGITPNSSGLAQVDAGSGSKGLSAPVDLKLSGVNTLLTGSGTNYTCAASDITAEKCPPVPAGNATGAGSFVRSRPAANWNTQLPNPLKYSVSNPGVLLGVHPDAVGQFFFGLWKNGGLNMTIDNAFLDKLALYRSESKNEPIRLVRQLLKAENLFAVLIPSGVTDPALTSPVIYKAKDSGGTVQTVEKTDEIVIRLRPLQAPYVTVDPPPAGATYIPKLNITLSDVEVQIFGRRGASEYRVIAFRLNLNTRAVFGIGGFQGDSTVIPNSKKPNHLAVKLDICNDRTDDYINSEYIATDCDDGNPYVSYSLVVTDTTWNGQAANPFGVSPSGLANVLSAVVKPALIPVFNHILGEIPLNPLGHCGIEVNQSYMKNPANGINAKIVPIDTSSSEPILLINTRAEIYLDGAAQGSPFNQGAPLYNTAVTLTPGVPPKYSGTCDLFAP